MHATFDVGGGSYLSIAGDVPRNAGSDRSVSLQVYQRPMFPGDAEANAMLDSSDKRGPKEDKLVASFQLKPSHARAIASALLSSATEARG